MTTKILETRSFAQIKEVRIDEEAKSAVVQGYATTFGSVYPVYGGPERGGWNEQIARGATKKSISENADVRFLINHDGLTLARTKSGTLNLLEDEIGLYMEANLDISRSNTAADLASAIDRGDVDQMSFAFMVVREEWSEDRTERTIREVKLVDVSAVTYPANEATQIKLRDQILEELEKREEKIETPNLDQIKSILATISK
jgi:HK97 family phage prohead protease